MLKAQVHSSLLEPCKPAEGKSVFNVFRYKPSTDANRKLVKQLYDAMKKTDSLRKTIEINQTNLHELEEKKRIIDQGSIKNKKSEKVENQLKKSIGELKKTIQEEIREMNSELEYVNKNFYSENNVTATLNNALHTWCTERSKFIKDSVVKPAMEDNL